MSDMNSARVAGLRWKTPRMALVTVWLPGFRIPRMDIQLPLTIGFSFRRTRIAPVGTDTQNTSSSNATVVR